MLTIVIPAAGVGRRMRSYGSKALIDLRGGERVIQRQIRLLREHFPSSRVLVVCGFEACRLRQILPSWVECVDNPIYETTNAAYSVALGLKQSHSDFTLVIYGDLVFRPKLLTYLDAARSSVLIDNNCRAEREGEVGVNVMDGEALYFSYGLPLKWAHLAIFASRERNLYLRAVSRANCDKYLTHEILNEVIERGGRFRAIQPKHLNLVEIDSSKDIHLARLIC